MNPDEIVRRYQLLYGQQRTATVRRMALLWQQLGGLDDEAAARFVAAAVSLMSASEQAVARTVVAYLTLLTRQTAGEASEVALAASNVTGRALRGVDPAEVYQRPVVTARAAISEGKSFIEAMQLAHIRVKALTDSDIALTQRLAATEAMKGDKRIVGYRRVLTGKSCGLCATASTQRYTTDSLMPIHAHCDCGIAPIIGDSDPGRIINDKLLSTLQQRGPAYWKSKGFVDVDGNPVEPGLAVPTVARLHGEMGPVLVDPADHFKQLAA